MSLYDAFIKSPGTTDRPCYLARMAELHNIVVIDESKNPSGTYKDRRSAYIVDLALKEGVSTLCLITAGNAGCSLGLMARPKGIRVVSIVNRSLKLSIKEKLAEACDSVVECDLNEKILKPEDVIALARSSDDEAIWDVTNGYAAAYESIIDEVKDEDFDYLVCPVGSGEAFVGLYLGIKRHRLRTKLVGVGVEEHPSFADKLSTPWTPYEDKIKEILLEGHRLYRLSEEEVRTAYEGNKGRYASEPSSTVVWVGLEKLAPSPDEKVAVLNSGKGLC